MRMARPARVHAAALAGVLDPYAIYLFYDSFTGNANVALPSHTPEKGAGWASSSIESRQHKLNGSGLAVPNTANVRSAVVSNGNVVADGTFEWTVIAHNAVALPAWGRCLFNYLNATNFWHFGFATNTLVLAKRVANVDTTIFTSAAQTIADGSTHTIKVVTNGDNVKVYYDGALAYDPLSDGSGYTASNRDLKTAQGIGWWTANSAGGENHYLDLFTAR